jgi:hypothetical protein
MRTLRRESLMFVSKLLHYEARTRREALIFPAFSLRGAGRVVHLASPNLGKSSKT